MNQNQVGLLFLVLLLSAAGYQGFLLIVDRRPFELSPGEPFPMKLKRLEGAHTAFLPEVGHQVEAIPNSHCRIAYVCTTGCPGCRQMARDGMELREFASLEQSSILLSDSSGATAFADSSNLAKESIWIPENDTWRRRGIAGMYGTPTMIVFNGWDVLAVFPVSHAPSEEEVRTLCGLD